MLYLWLRTWQLGIKSLLLHPLRSLLTVLGIFIGVASVIWLLAIGEGISRKAQEQIEGLGANNIIVRSIKPPSEVTESQRGLVPYGLTRDDFERLTETIPTIERALPIRETPPPLRLRAAGMVDGRLVGCTPEYADVTQLDSRPRPVPHRRRRPRQAEPLRAGRRHRRAAVSLRGPDRPRRSTSKRPTTSWWA